MATLNYAFKEISCKIVYYGCGLCGKTTNLQFIHTTVPGKYRGELVSLATEQDRTLFFDFLPLDLGEVKGFKTKFQLYTVPGQVYYNATRKLVLRGVDGLVFVVDSQRDRLQENLDSLENLKQNLADYGYSLDEIPWVIQYNKRDMPDVMDVAEMEKAINFAGVPWYESVATTGQGVREALKGISALVIRHLSQSGVGAGAPAVPKPTPGVPPRPPQPAVAGAPVAAAPAVAPAPPTRPAVPAGVAAAATAPPQPAPPSPTAGPAGARPPQAVPARPEAPAAAKARVRVDTVISPKDATAKKPLAEPVGPKLDVRQKCDVRWRGLRLGTAQLTLATRAADDGRGDYQLSGVVTLLGIFKQSWARLLRFKFREIKSYQGADTPFFRMESPPDDDGPVLTVWVKDGYDQQVFLYYSRRGGAVTLLPQGSRITP